MSAVQNYNTVSYLPSQQGDSKHFDVFNQDHLSQEKKANIKIQIKDSSSDIVTSPILKQNQQQQHQDQQQQQLNQQSIGTNQNLNINQTNCQQVYQKLEMFKNFQDTQNLQSPPYSEDPKNPQNYLFISSLPGSKYGSQTQISNSQSQNQLSSHNLQAFGNNQSHQHSTVNSQHGQGSNGKPHPKQQINQPEIKSYKQVKAIHRESKLLTPTSAFSPEIQKVIEDMKQKQMIQTNDSSEFALGCLVANNIKNEGTISNNSSNLNKDSIKDSVEKRRLSALEMFQLKSHQIVQDLNSIQQQVRIDSANVAIKRNTISTLNNIMLSQNGSLASLKDQHFHKLQVIPKNQTNIQSLTSLDKQNLSTEANRLLKSKYQQYGRNSITSNRFNEDRARLKEALLTKQENTNKNENAIASSKMQTISLPDISYGFHSQSEMGSDKKSLNTRQVKTRGSLEHLDDLEEENKDYVIQNSQGNSLSNQSSPRRKKLESSLQDYLSDSKSDSPLPQIKINKIDKVDIPQIKQINLQNNVFLKRSLDCVNEVLQDQDSKILPSPQFAQSNSQKEQQQGQNLSSVETFSSSEDSQESPNQKEESSLNMIRNYFPITNKIENKTQKANRKDQQEKSEQLQEIKHEQFKSKETSTKQNNNNNKINQQQITQQKDSQKQVGSSNEQQQDQQKRLQKANQIQNSQNQNLMLTPDQKQTKEYNLVNKEKSLQSSIVSLKNDKTGNGGQNFFNPITISDIQPLESDRKTNENQYNMLLKQQNQQFNIHEYSPIQVNNLQNKDQDQDQNQKSQNNKEYNMQQSPEIKNEKITRNSQNSNNLEQISQKLLQNQLKQINKNEKTIPQQGFNSFGSEVDLQVFLQDIQYRQEEEKRLQLQNQLIEARLELDTNYKSILNSINPSPRMAAISQQGYFSNPTQYNAKSFGDLLGSEIFTLSNDLNLQQNLNGNQRKSSKASQNTNNLQEKINSRIQKQMVQKPNQISPIAVALKKEVMRAMYYQKDIQYKGDGKFKSPKRVSVKSVDGQDIEEIEYVEEDLHITNILSDNYVESLDYPSNRELPQQKQSKQQQIQTFNFNQPSYLRATKSFQQNIISSKSIKDKKQTQKKFKFK
ncbi:hypothetical protein TTHERM_00348950 (macronuclear) [Tetrahymena thermophila SB210]|uniref:Uncharacterized protein n=1 Tax=Tetrahymena thermophila (strain SB210) TaxID=312017 RepID=I7M3B1_TETTS|nr:hypothetical protein TTHERM_00348950 [Tetrahymena thermophila SB210]EAS02805.2 hypothetical protein TTHERM_00348950 [Tetrahymena thermophila SB210]|eukprot:XP_001023050.2 hypothetical protein TTHERM_00348950 [Tetrahymena thermophila SB210]